jgi:hypothetical protein
VTRRRGPILAAVLVLLAAATITAVVLLRRPDGPPEFRPRFPVDGLVTNELTQRHGDEPGVRRSADWVATSGSLFAVGGMGFSGVPDGSPPDAGSRSGTDSAVFRLISRRTDFGDVRVRFRLRVSRQVTTPRTPAEDYDGVHLLVRYQSPQQLYAVSLQRRDGIVSIKRKDPGGPANGGTYVELAKAPFALVTDWLDVDVRVHETGDGGTALELRAGDRLVVEAVDRSPQRITAAGALGIRADNTEFYFADFVAGVRGR